MAVYTQDYEASPGLHEIHAGAVCMSQKRRYEIVCNPPRLKVEKGDWKLTKAERCAKHAKQLMQTYEDMMEETKQFLDICEDLRGPIEIDLDRLNVVARAAMDMKRLLEYYQDVLHERRLGNDINC